MLLAFTTTGVAVAVVATTTNNALISLRLLLPAMMRASSVIVLRCLKVNSFLNIVTTLPVLVGSPGYATCTHTLAGINAGTLDERSGGWGGSMAPTSGTALEA